VGQDGILRGGCQPPPLTVTSDIMQPNLTPHSRLYAPILFVSVILALLLPGCSRKPERLRTGISSAELAANDLTSQESDSAQDGTPDFLRLDDEADRQAFRRWFTFLAEVQYFTPPAQRPPEIVDCAALVRYAYREALRADRANWSALSRLALLPAIDPVRKYSYPNTPLGANLFRVKPGPFTRADLKNDAFAQFADAETLERFNTSFVTRDIARALPGDLLFYRQPTEHMPFHTMIFLGRSQVTRSSESFIVYDTGPDGTHAGQIRRLALSELLHYPDPRWQPVATNPSFLGVFRWNILKQTL